MQSIPCSVKLKQIVHCTYQAKLHCMVRPDAKRKFQILAVMYVDLEAELPALGYRYQIRIPCRLTKVD